MRNSMTAHNFRDRRNKNKPTDLQENYFDAEVPKHYAEIALLTEFAVYAIATVICRHPEDHNCQLNSIPTFTQKPCKGIQTFAEFEKAVSDLQALLCERDQNLKKCFGI